MKFTLTIDCGNAAFEDDYYAEIARILKVVALDCENDAGPHVWLIDANGNRVGSCELTP